MAKACGGKCRTSLRTSNSGRPVQGSCFPHAVPRCVSCSLLPAGIGPVAASLLELIASRQVGQVDSGPAWRDHGETDVDESRCR
jgi:hypothetical protein